jgi:hypothetical protein
VLLIFERNFGRFHRGFDYATKIGCPRRRDYGKKVSGRINWVFGQIHAKNESVQAKIHDSL